TNAAADLLRREADIAIRNFRPEQPDLIARKMHEVPASLWATPDYLRSVGDPGRDDEMSGGAFIGFTPVSGMVEFLGARGLKVTSDNFVLVSANHLVQWEMVKAGLGIGVMTDRIAEREPLVTRAIPDMEPVMVPAWLTTHREVSTNRRVRL